MDGIMDFKQVFQFIIETFNTGKIDFAVIGGFALQFGGVTRTTLDIDLLILSADTKKVKDIMLGRSYKLLHESEDVLNFCSDDLKLGRVDFLLAHRKYAVAMLKRAQEKEILEGKFKVKVLRVEDQIGLKVQSGSNDPQRLSRDTADIESLIKQNYSNLDFKLLREYFALFGKEAELETIIERVKHA